MRIKRTIARLAAGSLLAGSLTLAGAAGTAVADVPLVAPLFSAAQALPSEAQAACTEWRLPYPTYLHQGNGWTGWLTFANGYWAVHASQRKDLSNESGMGGEVRFSSATAESVKFTITWSNGSGGVYTGKIDDNGFVSGKAVDRWTGAKTSWRLSNVAECVRR